MHHRQFHVVKNAFDPNACKLILNQEQCSYTPGNLSNITTAETPFGKTSILVCADAYTYPLHWLWIRLNNSSPILLLYSGELLLQQSANVALMDLMRQATLQRLLHI